MADSPFMHRASIESSFLAATLAEALENRDRDGKDGDLDLIDPTMAKRGGIGARDRDGKDGDLGSSDDGVFMLQTN